MDAELYKTFLGILRDELIPAQGCTEPIAIALASAKARELLGRFPSRIVIRCSGNIVKNVKGVVVPNSGGQKGIEVAAILGAVGGRADLNLEVVALITPEQIETTRDLCRQGLCRCELVEGEENLFIRAEASEGDDVVAVEISHRHTNISRIEKNGQVLFSSKSTEAIDDDFTTSYTLADIFEFVNRVDIDDVRDTIERQIEFNSAISAEGLSGEWGGQVGRTILESCGNELKARARAAAAAGSDARMNGCNLPVIINSGSGNQGITCTMPVVVYAREMSADHERLCRALVLANLIAIHQKKYIGKLSAYCGAVSAGAAAACGIAYLEGADYDLIGQTLTNTIANVGGIVCDGAKASCAAKIASSVDAGLIGYELAKRNHTFPFGEGLVEKDYETTIRNIGRVGCEGMRSTDVEILRIMTGQ